MTQKPDPMIGILIRDGREIPYIMESSGPDGQYEPREFASWDEAEAFAAKSRQHSKIMQEAAAAFDREFLGRK